MSVLDFDALWDYERPGETETAFRQLLEKAEREGELSYLLQLLTQIARAQGLQRHFDEAHATLDRAQRSLTAELLVAKTRYLLERGRVYNSSGRSGEARSWFQQAWELAQAQQETFYAIDAAHMLAIVAPPDEGIMWNMTALQLAEAATDERARHWCGSLYNNLGWTYHDLGEYNQALALFEKAVQWHEAEGQVRQIRIARWCVGRVLRSLGRCGEALSLQQELLDEWERDGGGQDGYVSEEIGECLLALGRKQECQAYFAQAYALLSQNPWLIEREKERLQRLKRLGEESGEGNFVA